MALLDAVLPGEPLEELNEITFEAIPLLAVARDLDVLELLLLSAVKFGSCSGIAETIVSYHNTMTYSSIIRVTDTKHHINNKETIGILRFLFHCLSATWFYQGNEFYCCFNKKKQCDETMGCLKPNTNLVVVSNR